MPDSMLYIGIACIIIGTAAHFFTEWIIKIQGPSKGRWSYTEEQRREKLKIVGLPLMILGIIMVYSYFFG